jgi:hypothetical protein
MNISVQAEVLTIGFTANIVNPKITTTLLLPNDNISVVVLCLHLPKLSVNGHSISAINPEDILIGGMATSAMA